MILLTIYLAQPPQLLPIDSYDISKKLLELINNKDNINPLLILIGKQHFFKGDTRG